MPKIQTTRVFEDLIKTDKGFVYFKGRQEPVKLTIFLSIGFTNYYKKMVKLYHWLEKHYQH